MRIIYILSSFFLLFPLLATAQSPLTNQHLFDTIPFMPEHYAQRVADFEQEPIVTGQIIFLGNSITEMGQWAQLLHDSTVVNRGIGGDITYGVLKRLDDIIRRQPSKLFLLIGINDIGKDIPDAVIADNCRKIVQAVQSKSPATQMYVQSILPINPAYPRFPQHYDKQSHVLTTNQLLKKVAESTKCRFVNLFPIFLDSQKRLDAKYTTDGLHLNEAGYAVWVKYLKQSGCL